MIVELRKKLQKHKDLVFTLYMCLLGMLASGGLNSGDKAYKVVFAIVCLLWLTDLLLTDFNLREIIALAIVFGLLGMTLITNREKTLILTAMAVSGAKGVNLKKCFFYALCTKVFFSLELYALVLFGLITNEVDSLVKGSVVTERYCFGYYCANQAFTNLLTIAFLVVLAFSDKLKWYIYLLISLILVGGYKLFYCRTGILVWIFFIISLLVYCLVKKSKLREAYLYLFTCLPTVLCLLTLVMGRLCKAGNKFAMKIDVLLHDRLSATGKHPVSGLNLFGQSKAKSFDNGYYHLIYNYGYIFTLLCLIAYVFLIIYLVKKNMDLEVLILASSCLLIFMEFAGLSIVWNFALVFFSLLVFRDRRKVLKEKKNVG